MKLLLLADKESPYLWDYYQPGRLREYDLMLSCGDLKAEYLSFLATLGRAPLYYVRGNHDGNYDRRPPEGCDCIEDKLIIFNGLRIAGLGGSRLYSGGKDQYSEREMKNRIWKLGWADPPGGRRGHRAGARPGAGLRRRGRLRAHGL